MQGGHQILRMKFQEISQEISKFFQEIILRFEDFNFSLIIDKIQHKRKL